MTDASAWTTLYVDTDRHLRIRTAKPPARDETFFDGVYETRGADAMIITGRGSDVILRKRR